MARLEKVADHPNQNHQTNSVAATRVEATTSVILILELLLSTVDGSRVAGCEGWSSVLRDS